MLQIRAAQTPADLAAVRTLFVEYAAGLGVDLGFQDFTAELAGLPGKYAPPTGALLIAVDPVTAEAAGCVALRPLGPAGDHLCEMKRLYVRPAFRGQHLGRRLCEAILAEARRLNYRAMRLDTLRSLSAAMRLYTALGFVEIPAYYHNPVPDVSFLELRW